MTLTFEPTRQAGLEHLSGFLPHAGGDYAKLRNYDLGDRGHPHVSKLSPYIRHRMISEEEVLQAVLGRFSLRTAEKFIQEVYWRTYWKGWLEMRPAVWTGYKAGLARTRDRLAVEGGMRRDWEAACKGKTGIAPFDAWAQELVATGYLHNHARMWFASIWIFTLRLPWELGADFFMRHLLDGDPASNTLGWRWVAGLQTKGKVYAARSSNITKYTEGRFGGIHGLAQDPEPIKGPDAPGRSALPEGDGWAPGPATGLLLTEDDLYPGWMLPAGFVAEGVAVLNGAPKRSPLAVAPQVLQFTEGAIMGCLDRYGVAFGPRGPITSDPQEIADWAEGAGLARLVLAHAPVGPAADLLRALEPMLLERGIDLIRCVRDYDRAAWPHATHGFFRFKEKIPSLVGHIKGLRAA